MQQRELIKRRVNEIDLLRFLAALSVVFFHYSFSGYHSAPGYSGLHQSALPYPAISDVTMYAYLGVQLFFLISGFVILMTAANGSLRQFVISRIVRLYPAFWACCTITAIAIAVFGRPVFSVTLSQYLANMTMLSEYFGINSVDGSYWTLFVELRFYALVAIVLAFGKIDRIQPILGWWLAIAIGLYFHPIPKGRFFFMDDFAAYFIGGAVSYLIWSRGLSIGRAALFAASMAFGTFVAVNGRGSFVEYFNVALNPWIVASITAVSYLLILAVALGRTGVLQRMEFRAAGALTYPLYLIHQDVGYIIFNHAYPAVNPHLLFWGTIILALCSAQLIYVAIERPLAPRMKSALNRAANTFINLKLKTPRHFATDSEGVA